MLKSFLSLFTLLLLSNISQVLGAQENPQIQLNTARKLIQEQKYEPSIDLLKEVRATAKNSTKSNYDALIYVQAIELESKVYLLRKEYDLLSDFLRASTSEFCAEFTKNEIVYIGRVIGILQQLEQAKKYPQALSVYELLYETPKRFEAQKSYFAQKIDGLHTKMGQKSSSSPDDRRKTLRDRDVKGMLSTLMKYQGQMDDTGDDDGEDTSLSEALGVLNNLPSMFGLDEESTLEDLKNTSFDEMNLDFDALKRMTELSGEDDEDSEMALDSIRYMWNVAKNNDSLLFTKQKKSSEGNLATLNNSDKMTTSHLIENYNLYSSNILLRDYIQAERYLKEFERIFNALSPEERGGYANETINISFWTLYINKKEYGKALEYAFKRQAENTNPKYETSILMHIVMTYFMMKDFVNAEKWSKKTISRIQENGFKNRESTLNQARMFYYQSQLATGKYEAALKGFESIGTKVEKNRESKTSSSWELYFSPVAGKAIANLKLGNVEKADQYMAEYIRLANSEIFQSILGVDTGMALAENSDKYVADNIFYFLSQRSNASGSVVTLGYNSALIFKELLLKKEKTIAGNYLKTSDEELKTLFYKYIATKERSKDLHVDKAISDSLADYDRAYEKILKKKGKDGLVNLFDTSKLSFKDVWDKLGTDEVAVEFVTYSPYEFMKNADQLFYGAFVLHKDNPNPVFIPLCSEKQLQPLVKPIAFRGNTAALTKRIYSTNRQAIYDLVWKPIEHLLKAPQKVYYAPTGLLHNISFDALTNNGGAFLSQSKTLIRLGSTKNIAPHRLAEKYDEIVLFGAIDYDMMNSSGTSDSGERSKEFDFLPGTQNEIDQIELLLKSKGVNTHINTEAQATEEAFYQAVNEKPDLLHIATHGFYVVSSEEDMFSVSEHMGYARIKENADAMNRSGLAFAGANAFWKSGQKNGTGAEDGILTANELAALDIGQTKLVVLSACETGIGEVLNNEGVFGLQRGLKMAGAQNLLLALWKVDDRVTQEYMVSFYDFLISKKMPIAEAYAKTQEKIRKKYPDPYYWAPFVLIQ